MYYISDIKGIKAGVTDTEDGVTEYYTNQELVAFHKKGIKIYGISVYNHNAECTVLKLGKTLQVEELKKRLNSWRDLHNPWTGMPVEYYLAEARVGTQITINYSDKDSSGRPFKGTTILLKSDIDTWHFRDTNSVFDREDCDTNRALRHLEVAAIYSKPTEIKVKG